MGMSRDDFERCTPSEFAGIHKQWQERETRLYRDGWEQVRTLAGFILQLFKTRKTAAELLPFPWDSEKENAAPKGGSTPEVFREIVKKRANGG